MESNIFPIKSEDSYLGGKKFVNGIKIMLLVCIYRGILN